MVLLHLIDESQKRLADFGYIPECKSKNPRGLNEISLPLARMQKLIPSLLEITNFSMKFFILLYHGFRAREIDKCKSVQPFHKQSAISVSFTETTDRPFPRS